ncbi:MAG TPA: EAL domain-containing protein, partial [Burkholderiales bacterium]|nr:EAL domain-containing protein [Burkholderiales bacterium]
PPLRVLLLIDSGAEGQLLLQELRRAKMPIEYTTARNQHELVRELESFSPQVVLADFPMRHFDGMAALALAREHAPEVPFLFVSGTIGEEHAIRAFREGAADYVLKGNLRRLPRAINLALEGAKERAAGIKAARKLTKERERVASIVASLPDVVWSADYESHQILYVSPKVEEIFGVSTQAFQERPDLWFELIHPEDKIVVLEAWRGLHAGARFDLEYRIRRKDGTERWIHDRGRLIRSPSGEPERVDRVARDVSIEAEQRQRMARMLRVRDLIGSINSALIRVRKRDALFEEVCRVVVSVGGLRGARVAMVSPAAESLVWSACAGAQSLPAAETGGPAVQALISRLLHIGAPAVWNDLGSEPDEALKSLLAPEGALAAAAFPLRVEGRTAAFLALYSSQPGYFDDEEIEVFRDLSANLELALELIAKQEKLDYLALYDPLTGLPNRTLLREHLAQALETARRDQSKLALMLFDIERFKSMNDAFGQHAGDRMLQHTAGGVRAAAGDIQYAAHLGGDVFAIMMPHLHDAVNVATILRERAERILETPFLIDGRELRLQIKAGIAMFPDDATDADTLFRNAEAALKKAKQTGDRYLLYAPQINARVAERLELEHALRGAIERREFILHYQPKIELETRRIIGLEALVRWQRPGVGLVLPGTLIAVLEETGMITDLGPWVIEEAMATYRSWRDRGMPAPRIAVNVSPLQLRQPEFTRHLQSEMDKMPAPCGLEIEVTESLLMQDMEAATRKLGEVREMGVGVSLDDFGTGYSSLARLARLPVDTLKIDRAFIQGMTDHPDDTSIVTAIISLGHTLHRTVIAEGVELEEQARLLRLLRCEQIQGNVFSPAIPREKVEALLSVH